MPTTTSRRDWLKTSALATAAISLIPRAFEAQNTKGQTSRIIKLSGNENPYGYSPKARQAMIDALDSGSRYADPATIRQLEATIAAREGLKPESVVLATGSGEILCMAAMAYGKGEIVAPTPTFPTLMTYAEKIGASVRSVPLNARFEHDLEAMGRAVSDKTSIVFTCNPNNPTSSFTPNGELRQFCSETAKKVPVFSDEAYLEYTEDFPRNSMVELVKRGENVIVSRTFSKIYGMAGLRVGYALARPDIIQGLRNFRMTWLNHLSMRAALAAYEDHVFVTESKTKNRRVRTDFLKTLDEMKRKYVSPEANFVWVNVGKGQTDLGDRLLAHNILLGNPRAPENEWARITIGTAEEMGALVNALKAVGI